VPIQRSLAQLEMQALINGLRLLTSGARAKLDRRCTVKTKKGNAWRLRNRTGRRTFSTTKSARRCAKFCGLKRKQKNLDSRVAQAPHAITITCASPSHLACRKESGVVSQSATRLSCCSRIVTSAELTSQALIDFGTKKTACRSTRRESRAVQSCVNLSPVSATSNPRYPPCRARRSD